MKKQCKKCNKYKPLQEFHKSKPYKFGVYTLCKSCVAQRHQEARGGITLPVLLQTEARFKKMLRPLHDGSGCIVWTGTTFTTGYGSFRVNGYPLGSHRVAWALANGVWPSPEMHVCHHCDNPACVNPEHLFIGRAAENMADMVKKGRQAKGERNPATKVTHSQVVRIRIDHAHYGVTITELATRYGITATAVNYIVTGKNWAHAPGPIKGRDYSNRGELEKTN